MSITKALYIGVTGLQSHGDALGVVGDNIANVNTTGYKKERIIFSDLLGRSIGSVNKPGSGVKVDKVTRSFTQGTLLTTDSPTDLAINGKGFFIVSGDVSGISANFYTRAGQFTLDKQGNLVNPLGFIVQGYLVNAAGELDNQLTDLQIANSVLPPSMTELIDISANLDAAATEDPGGAAFSTTSPGTTSNFSTAMTVYDSLGEAHRVDIYFRKTGSNAWEYHALVDGGDLTGGTTGTAVEMAAGTLTFTTDGWLDTETSTVDWDTTGTTPTFNNASDQAITFEFGDSITTDGGTGQAGTTQYASSSTIRSQDQDGYATGELSAVGVESNGDVLAVYYNGQQRLVGKLALATFEAEDRLSRVGDGLWAESIHSGEARISAASTGSSGAITSGALEQSTVDLADEFVDLISYQRGFQANARTISTADQLYMEVVNLKR
ncbi:MAG: flagellar hook protein FlgE [Myxococcota bacterium]|nr:flagellar hook protein FlgE [Myxococcota bacterium]